MYAFGSSMKGSARTKSTSCQSKLTQNVNSSFQSTAMINNNKRLSPQREIAFWISYPVFRRSIALLSSQIIPLSCVSLDIPEHRSLFSPFWTVLSGFYNNGNNGSLSAAFRFKYTIYGPLYEEPIATSIVKITTNWKVRVESLHPMINNDVSQGKERVKVPVVNELDDEKPSAFGVMWSQCDKGHWVHNDAVLEMFIFIPKKYCGLNFNWNINFYLLSEDGFRISSILILYLRVRPPVFAG